MDGITLTPLKIIHNEKGNIFHALKCSENSFSQFGEAYFTTIKKDQVKGWKKHKEMILNLVVPIGVVKFVIYDDREGSNSCGEFHEVIISNDNYARLTVEPGLWVAFQGLYENESLILNVASIEHQPEEAENADLSNFEYEW